MARVALCDRCGAIIRDAVVKQIGFSLSPKYAPVLYDVCDKCYDELEKSMKINKEKANDSKL